MRPASTLARVPLFSVLPEAHLVFLSNRLRQRAYRKGQVIFHQEDPGLTMHLIESGQVKIVYLTESGAEMLLAMLGPGEFFGELALLDGRPRSATAVAAADTVTLQLYRQDLLDVLKGSSEAALAVCAALAQRLRAANGRLAESAFLDLPTRLAGRLLEMARGKPLRVAMTQDELAAVLGAARQSVNKLLGQWEREGLVSRRRGEITILRPEGLVRR